MNGIFSFLAEYIVLFETALLFLLGGFIAYYRGSAKLRGAVSALIAEAEQLYRDAKSGGKRFNWVVNKLYSLVPAPLKAIINKQMIAELVQGTFDSMAQYAKTQLDRVVDGVISEKIPDKEE